MKKVTIYTRPLCGYCARAMALLKSKGVEIDDKEAGMDKALREEMLSRSNGKTTYPQIFIGDTHIGGSDELAALERDGKLDVMLND